jgi:hypothetical protein
MRAPRDYAGIQQALARAGYKGERMPMAVAYWEITVTSRSRVSALT